MIKLRLHIYSKWSYYLYDCLLYVREAKVLFYDFLCYSHGNILRPFARQKHRRIGGSGLPRYFQEMNMLMLQK